MLLVLLSMACSVEFVGGSGDLSILDWGGPPGAYLELAPQGMPDSPALLIEVGEDAWEIRYGSGWSGAQVLGMVDVRADSTGYAAGDSMLVPQPIEVGSTAEGSTITARGEVEVWYGTFPDAVEVDVGGGDFVGSAAFAPGVGPIRLDYQGKSWELVYYE